MVNMRTVKCKECGISWEADVEFVYNILLEDNPKVFADIPKKTALDIIKDFGIWKCGDCNTS